MARSLRAPSSCVSAPRRLCLLWNTGFAVRGQSWFAGGVTAWRVYYWKQSLTWLAVFITWTNVAAAQAPDSLEVTMAYSSTSGCPTEATFSAGLRRLMPHLELRAVGPRAPRLQVTFERRETEFVGRLVYGETSREVTAAACADAAYALAVVTAITLEPDAQLEQDTVDADDFVETTIVEEQTRAEPKQSTGSPSQQRERQRMRPRYTPELPRRSSPSDVRRWTPLGGPFATYGELGASAWGLDVSVLSAGTSAVNAYRLSLRGMFSTRDLTVTTLTYTRVGAAAAWCPRFAGTDGWEARACVGGEIGLSHVSTRETPNVEQLTSRNGLSAAAGLDVVLSFALGKRWRLALVPGLLAPLIRHRYVLESSPGVTTRGVQHQRLVAAAGLQVGYVFD